MQKQVIFRIIIFVLIMSSNATSSNLLVEMHSQCVVNKNTFYFYLTSRPAHAMLLNWIHDYKV